MAPTVPIGAAGEKFLKFDAFLCIFKAFFRFPSPVRGGGRSPSPPLATPLHSAWNPSYSKNHQKSPTTGANFRAKRLDFALKAPFFTLVFGATKNCLENAFKMFKKISLAAPKLEKI